MIIYKITNKINGKVYIGQTTQKLHERWSMHCSKHSNCPAIHLAIQKYGKENFTIEQIDVACDRHELGEKEQRWIEYYDCISPKGYNLKGGGEHPILSEETKRKIGNANRGRKLSDEQRKIAIKALSQTWKSGEEHPFYGKKHSEKTRQKISEILKGRFLGSERYNAKSVLCVETGKIFDSVSTAGREMNIESKNINAVVVGKRNRAGGYHWRYAE